MFDLLSVSYRPVFTPEASFSLQRPFFRNAVRRTETTQQERKNSRKGNADESSPSSRVEQENIVKSTQSAECFHADWNKSAFPENTPTEEIFKMVDFFRKMLHDRIKLFLFFRSGSRGKAEHSLLAKREGRKSH
ncbi:MAG: hypothetical protein K5922_02305 [Clostridiales bacterium]|nr:hypothetical protein [Clostridiales bacterium]